MKNKLEELENKKEIKYPEIKGKILKLSKSSRMDFAGFNFNLPKEKSDSYDVNSCYKDIANYISSQYINKEKLKQIVIEDVPHQFQDRLLNQLTN